MMNYWESYVHKGNQDKGERGTWGPLFVCFMKHLTYKRVFFDML